MNARLVVPAVPLPQTGRLATLAAATLAIGGLVALRAAGLHSGLLYPDGYQYLLMAQGLVEHLDPVTALGAGGDVLGPNADAAAKPFFPLLVAALTVLGLSPLAAAQAITVAAGAAIPVLTALVAVRLGATRPVALVAAALSATSTVAGDWWGFAGPDPLAPALALTAALAFLSRHPLAGGVLAGLCLTTRPSYALVALAAALAGLVAARTRPDALRAIIAGCATITVVLAVVRPPITAPDALTVGAAAVLVSVAAAVVLLAGRMGRVVAFAVAAAVVVPLAALDGGAWSSVARRDWALLGLAGAGLVLGLRAEATRSIMLRIIGLSLPLAVVYWAKNPGLERYLAQLVPELALVAALGIGTLRRQTVLVAAAGVAVAGALASSSPPAGPDAFQELAPKLERAPAGILVTAAPDAYGVLLSDRGIRVMRPGAEGLVLVDAAARAYEPDLRVDGEVISRIPVTTGFLRPDGTVDRAPAVLYRGRVVTR